MSDAHVQNCQVGSARPRPSKVRTQLTRSEQGQGTWGQRKETTPGVTPEAGQMEGSKDQCPGIGPALPPLGAPRGSNSLALLLALS